MKEFSTYDIYQAAYLVMKGVREEMRVDKRGKVVFLFNFGDGVEDELRKFNAGDQVNVLQYTSIVKNLRNRMYSMLKEHERG